MTVSCAKCRFDCETEDAFCRKCGAPLVQEATFTELESAPALPVQAEISTVAIVTTARPPVSRASKTRQQALALTRKVGSKVGEALKSEQGKKLTQGAAALAVAVGVELVTHAANRLTKAPVPQENRQLTRPPVSLPDALLKAMEDQLSTENSPVMEEVYIRERIYIKRVIRRRQG